MADENTDRQQMAIACPGRGRTRRQARAQATDSRRRRRRQPHTTIVCSGIGSFGVRLLAPVVEVGLIVESEWVKVGWFHGAGAHVSRGVEERFCVSGSRGPERDYCSRGEAARCGTVCESGAAPVVPGFIPTSPRLTR